MERKAVSGIMVTLLFISMLTVAFNIRLIEASGTIHIRANGSVDPPTAPISTVDNTTYTFTDNIYDEIVVERDNIVVDGAGCVLQGTGSGTGIDLTGRSNITIKNMEIKAFYDGIYLSGSLNNTVTGSNITNNTHCGVWLASSSNNTISGNNISTSGEDGIHLWDSSNNTISDNVSSGNGWDGIWAFDECNHNLILNNNVSENTWGIWLDDCSHNLILNNHVSNNTLEGMTLWHIWEHPFHTTTNNTLRNNNMTCNGYNFRIRGDNVSDFIHDIDTSNTVDGKRIYYLVNQKNVVIDSSTFPDIGYLGLLNSTNIVIKNLNLDIKNWQGIMFAYVANSSIENVSISNTEVGIYIIRSCNNTMTENLVTKNQYGFYLELSECNTIEYNKISNNSLEGLYFLDSANYNIIKGNEISNSTLGLHVSLDCHNNTVTGNTIMNDYYGIELINSSDNFIYHNNFIANTIQVSVENATDNIWDDGYPSGGNYWSDHTGVDLYSGPYQNETGSDGISDIPYAIDSEHQDNYPYVNKDGWGPVTYVTVPAAGQKYNLTIESDAFATHMVATQCTLHFNVTGLTGQTAYVNVTVPVGLNQTEIKVFVNDVKLTYPPYPIITSNGTHYFIYFEFTLSTHAIAIQYAIADITITNITPSKTVVGQGYTLPILITIQNQGNYTENSNVTAYANTTIIDTLTNITLTSVNSTTITLIWNTTGIPYGNYNITATATPVPDETDTLDNTLTNGWVVITITGDVNGDGTVVASDLLDLCKTYGCGSSKPNWNPNCDLNGDNKIDASDLFDLSKNYGKTV